MTIEKVFDSEADLDYFSRSSISNSDIGTFLSGGPSKYKATKEGSSKSETDGMALGSCIHAYMLEVDKFYKEYVITDITPPSSDSIRSIIEIIFKEDVERGGWAMSKLEEKRIEILQVAKAIGYGQAWKEDTIIEKVLKERDYYDTLKSTIGAKIVSKEEAATLEALNRSIASHKKANALMGMKDGLGIEVLNEFEIYWSKEVLRESDVYTGKCTLMKLKSKLDKLILDHKNKKAIYVDLKTTSYPVHFFKTSWAKYQYHRQFAFYRDAIKWYIKKKYGQEYEIELYCLAMETCFPHRVLLLDVNRVITMREECPDIEIGRVEYLDILQKIAWHEYNNLWEYNREYYEGNGSEGINKFERIGERDKSTTTEEH